MKLVYTIVNMIILELQHEDTMKTGLISLVYTYWIQAGPDVLSACVVEPHPHNVAHLFGSLPRDWCHGPS